MDDLSNDQFKRIIPDPTDPNPDHVERIVLCSGKLYYELDAAREERGLTNVAIHRLEQLYPIRVDDLDRLLSPYGAKTEVVWAKKNHEYGRWPSIRLAFGESIGSERRPSRSLPDPPVQALPQGPWRAIESSKHCSSIKPSIFPVQRNPEHAPVRETSK